MKREISNRAKAASEEVTLEELSRILLSINKKRGYKSSRKTKGDDEGNAIDGMETAKTLHDRNLTPGEFAFELLQTGESALPEFYRSDLQAEFDRIWSEQQKYYPDILTEALKEQLSGKNEKQTWSICKDPFGIEGIKREKKGKELQKENYEWRAKALKQQMDLESLVVVLQKVNSQINASSGYLGNISDRSKELYFNKQTVGQYMMDKLAENPNVSLKNMVFYRQDYIDEFETIWNTQKQYHNELTDALKKEIRDVTIFYQRPLKSQKWLVSFCEFENRNKVIPKSSPLFQEFKIWQVLNNLKVNGKPVEQEEKERLTAVFSGSKIKSLKAIHNI